MAIITRAIESRYAQNPAWLAWLVCLSGGLLFSYEFFNQLMFGSLNTYLMQSFHISAHKLGILSSTYFYANAFFLFIAGMLLDRFSTRRWILIAMTFCTLGTLGFALSPNIVIAGVCRFIVGLGGAFCFLSGVRLASRWFEPRKMALLTGLLVTMAMIGAWTAQAPMAALVQKIGWRNAVLIDVAIGVIFIAWIWLVVQDRPKGSSALAQVESNELKQMGVWKSVRRALGYRQNWLCGGYTCLVNLPIYLLGALWGSMFLAQVYGYSKTQATFISSMIFIGTVVGSPLMGWISDRVGNRKVPMLVSAVISLFLILIVIYDAHLSYTALLVLFFLLGLITSSQVISYPTVAESNPRALTGASVSIISTLILFSGAIMQPISGRILDYFWTGKFCGGVHCYSLSAYQHSMLIMPISFVVAIVLVFFIRETNCRRLDHLDVSASTNEAGKLTEDRLNFSEEV